MKTVNTTMISTHDDNQRSYDADKARAIDALPGDTYVAIQRYIDEGIPPGGFVSAVLQGDLFGVMDKADLHSRAGLYDICFYLYNYCPSACYGSREAVIDWYRKFD